MGRQETLERESRWRLRVGIAAIAGSLFYLGGTIGPQQIIRNVGDSDSERLTEFHAHASELLLFSVLIGIGFALFTLPLLYLFRADSARSDRVRQGLVGLMIAGPLFVAAGLILRALGVEQVASDFVATQAKAKDAEKLADDLVRDSGLVQASTGLGLAGAFGLSVALLYSSLWGMRTGLLSRFLGSLGMAVGVSFLLLGLIGQFLMALWFLVFGLMLVRGHTALPPAWEAGTAVPWPTPGQAAAEQLDPDVVEGTGSEVEPDPEAGGEESGPQHPPAEKRKRKRRR